MGENEAREQALEQTYPGALRFPELRRRLRKHLGARGFTDSNTLFANATCRDEINRGPLDGFGTDWGESFELSGLAGLPSAGLTGFQAYASHVPDNGHLLLLYGPHIGIGEDNTFGIVSRTGQEETSSACGAIKSFLGKIKQDPFYAPTHDALDPEQSLLEMSLITHAGPILAARDPMIAATEHTFEVIDSQILLILRESGYRGSIVLVGGIMINTPFDTDDRFALRRADVLPAGPSLLRKLFDDGA